MVYHSSFIKTLRLGLLNQYTVKHVGFLVMTAETTNITVFWNVTSCSLGRKVQTLRRILLLPPSYLKMEATTSSKTLLNIG